MEVSKSTAYLHANGKAATRAELRFEVRETDIASVDRQPAVFFSLVALIARISIVASRYCN